MAGQMRRRDGVLALSVGLVLLGVEFIRGLVLTSGALTEDWQFTAVQEGFGAIGLVTVVAILLVLRQGPATVGLRRTDVRRATTSTLVALAGLVAVIFLMALRDGTVHVTGTEGLLLRMRDFALGAIAEEVVFRGYITQRLGKLITRPALAQFCAVAVFVAGHLPSKMVIDPQYFAHFDQGEAVWLVYLFILGYVCDWLYRFTGSLFPGIATHYLINVLNPLVV